MQHLANKLRDSGMSAAINHADHVHDDWSEKAFAALRLFVTCEASQFMCEDVRKYAGQHLKLPEPPHNRAWGSVMMKAAKEGLIKRVGYGKTTSPSSHRTPAAIWAAA